MLRTLETYQEVCCPTAEVMVIFRSGSQAWREEGQSGRWPGAHGQRGPIFNEEKNVLYIILTVER